MMDIIQSNDGIAENDRSALSTLAAALKPFRELVGGAQANLPVSIVITFMLVAGKEGQTVGDLATAAGIPLARMSRQLSDLSDVNRYGAPGLGLIEQRVELHDRRYTRSRLTDKGRAFVRQIANAMERRMAQAA